MARFAVHVSSHSWFVIEADSQDEADDKVGELSHSDVSEYVTNADNTQHRIEEIEPI